MFVITSIVRYIFSECQNNDYPCISGTKCISRKLLCDNATDCPDNDDESHCSKYENQLRSVLRFVSLIIFIAKTFLRGSKQNCFK